MAEHGGDDHDAVELEFMRKQDFSWHPCQVSLSPNGNGLVIKYGDDSLEDLIVDKEVALTQLRIRSTPLHGTDCSLVKEGDRVLATKKSQLKSLFYDAEVEKAQRVRHSARTYCRCTFRVKWLHKDLADDEPILSSCAIMKLSTESVNVHPTVLAFFKSFDNSSCFTKMAFAEAPIGSTRSSTYAFEKKISYDSRFGAGIEGQNQHREFTTYGVLKMNVQVPSVTEHLRSSEHENLLHKDREAEDSAGVFMLFKGESIESRSRLSPLAARAALASLVSNISRGTKLFVHKEHEEFVSPTSIVGERVTMHSSSIRKNLDFCMASDLTTSNGISSKSEEKHQISDADSIAEMKGNRDFTSNSFSPAERKVRITRSASKRSNEVSHNSLAVTSDEVKLNPSTNQRLTRSALKRNQEAEIVSQGNKSVGSSTNEGIVLPSTEEEKCILYKLKTNTENITMKKTPTNVINVENLGSTRRLTRSAAREDTKKHDLNSSVSLEPSKLFDQSQSDASEVETELMGVEKSNSNSIVTEIQSPPAAEKNRLNQTHTTATISDENEGFLNKGLKRKLIGSKTVQLRSSRRLNPLPLTRS